MSDVYTLALNITAQGLDKLTQANRSLSQLDKDVARAKTAIKGLAVAFAAASAAAVGLGILAKKLLDLGSSAAETRNKFLEMFGDSTAAMDAFVKDFDKISGLTKVQTEDIVANAAMMAQGFGYSEQAAAKFAQAVIKLGGDLGSFLNIDTARAADAIRSALVGEREKLKQLNITLMESDVVTRALVNTGKKHLEQLTMMDRAEASLQIITERAGKAIGDQARTANSNTNVMRQLSAAWVDLKTQVGEFVDKAPFVNRFLQNVRNLVRDMTVLLNGQAENIRALFEGLGAIAGGAFLGSFLTAIDKLERFVIGSKMYNLLGGSSAGREAQKSFESASAGIDLIRHTARGLNPQALTPRGPGRTLDELTRTPLQRISGGPLVSGFGTLTPQTELTSVADKLSRMMPTMYPYQKIGKLETLSDALAQPMGSFASMLDDLQPHMIDFKKRSRDAADMLHMVAVAGLQASVGLVQLLKGKQGAGGILGGIMGIAGGIVGAINPLAGAALMAGGGLLTGLTAKDNKPVPVSIERYSANALNQRREDDEPINVTFITETGGQEVSRLRRTLRRAELRDGVIRGII